MKLKNYIGALLIFVVINLVHPVTPTIISEAKVPENMFGFLFASMSLGLALTSPLWGKLGDRYGRRVLFLLGISGYGLGQLLFVSTTNVFIMLLGRFIAGAMVGGATVNLYAYVTEHTHVSKRTSTLALIGALSTIALSFGYKLGGYLGVEYGAVTTAHIQTVSSILIGIYLFITFNARVHKEKGKKSIGIRQGIRLILTADSKNLLIMLIIGFFVTLSYVTAPKYLDYLFNDLGYTSNDLGNFVFVTGIVSLVVTLLLVYPLSKRFNEAVLIGVSVLGAGITMIIAFIIKVDFLVSMYIIWNIHVLFKTFHEPLDIAYISNSHDMDKGVLLGLRNTIRSVASVIGPIIGGYIYAYNKFYVFYFYGIILVLAGLCTFTIVNRKRG